MAIADLAIAADKWAHDEFRNPSSEGSRMLRRLAAETARFAEAAVPVDTGHTLASISVDERHGRDGIIWQKVTADNPVTDVLNSRSGVIRNPGKRTNQLTRTGRRKRARGGVRTVRPAEPFMRVALFETTKVEGF